MTLPGVKREKVSWFGAFDLLASEQFQRVDANVNKQNSIPTITIKAIEQSDVRECSQLLRIGEESCIRLLKFYNQQIASPIH
jgi:hypothetical protein